MAKLVEFGAIAAIAILASPAVLAANVSISNAWFRVLPAGLPAGGYFTLHNSSAAPAELVSATSHACGMVMLHRSTMKGGVSRMEDVNSVAVPAHGTVEFAPGGYHLMCMDPGSAMKPGARVGVTFVFADKSQSSAEFDVKNAGGK